MRRFEGSPKRGIRYTRRAGAYAVLRRGSEFLLTFQSAPKPEVQLPGGGIDTGENPAQAMRREVFEETGWLISNHRRLGVFRRFDFMPEYDMWAEKICHIYMARPVRQLGAPPEPDHTALWVGPEAAVDMLANDGDRHFFQSALALPSP